MKPDKKISLLEKYDFSKTGLLKKAGIEAEDPRAELYHDIAAIVQAMLIDLLALARGKATDSNNHKKLQEDIYRGYGWLQCKYRGIDWEELDPNDKDLQVFFKMKQLIDHLGAKLDAFLEQARKASGHTIENGKFKAAKKQIQDIGDMFHEFAAVKKRLAGV